MVQRSKLSLAWVVALLGSAAGVVLMIGLPDKQTAPAPRVVDPGTAPAATRPAVDEHVLDAVNAILAPPHTQKPIDPERMAKDIVAVGPEAIDVVVALLCGDAEARDVAVGTLDQPVHPRALEARDAILREALARFESAACVRRIAARGEGAPVDTRIALFPLLGANEHPTAVRELVELSAALDPLQWHRQFVTGGIERALAAQLERKPEYVRELRGRWRTLEPDFAAVLVRALASVRSKATTDFLFDALGRDGGLDLEILRSLGRMGAGGRLPVPDGVPLQVRRYLGSVDEEVRRAALDALGAIGDAESVGEMVDALSDADPLVVRAAHRSLSGLAGADRGERPEGWARWQADERRWREREFDALAERLQDAAPGTVVGAIQGLLAHPLYRHESAEAIAPLAASANTAVARAAVDALGALGSARALPGLLTALESDDEGLRTRARDALGRLTGLSLPAEYGAWSAALER